MVDSHDFYLLLKLSARNELMVSKLVFLEPQTFGAMFDDHANVDKMLRCVPGDDFQNIRDQCLSFDLRENPKTQPSILATLLAGFTVDSDDTPGIWVTAEELEKAEISLTGDSAHVNLAQAGGQSSAKKRKIVSVSDK